MSPIKPSFDHTSTHRCCQDQINFPEIKLKPTLCADCEKVGMISEWLKTEPSMKYEIVKAWKQSQRKAESTTSTNSTASLK